MVPVIHRLINFPLIPFDPTARTVHCCLCDSYKFDCVHGGEELVRYLTEFHHIKHSDRIENAEIIGDIGKFPVYMKCEVCGVILTSILNSTTHMKKLHKDSGQEKNKLFTCDICHQGFYFQSSLNSHKSKAHQETSGLTFRCPLCTSVTNSKNGMRRHLRNSHKRTDLLNEELSYKCRMCEKLFWTISERTVHIAENHKEASEILKNALFVSTYHPTDMLLGDTFKECIPMSLCFKMFPSSAEIVGYCFPKDTSCPTSLKLTTPRQ